MSVQIAHQLGAEDDAWLRSLLEGKAQVLALPGDDPWAVPRGTDILLVGNARIRSLSRSKPDWANGLRWMHVRPTGLDDAPEWLFDLPHLTVSRGATAAGISEYVLAAMLARARPLTPVKAIGDWKDPPVPGLERKTLGLFGYGAIGRAIAERARPFGMRVIATRRNATASEPGVEFVAPETLCAESDHLVICAALTPETRGAFDEERFAACRPGLHLINVARGAIVVPDALRRALGQTVAHATLDVWTEEPPRADDWIYSHPDVTLTPHCSHLSASSAAAHRDILAQNLSAYLEGLFQAFIGRVDRAAGY